PPAPPALSPLALHAALPISAWFHKDLKTYIYNQDVAFDFSDFPLPPPIPGQDVYPDSPIGRINQPFNGEGGTIRGLELTASVPLDRKSTRLNSSHVKISYAV